MGGNVLPDAGLCHLKLCVGCGYGMKLLYYFLKRVEARSYVGYKYFLFDCEDKGTRQKLKRRGWEADSTSIYAGMKEDDYNW